MRKVIYIAFAIIMLSVICACKTQKDHFRDATQMIDSVSVSANNRTIEFLDSAFRSTSFDFDTLEVRIERYFSVADTSAIRPEVFNLRAVKGRIIDRQSALSEQLESYNRLDTVAYKKASSEESSEHTTTTRVYSPPNGNLLFGLLLLIAAGLLYVILQKKLK